MQAIKPKERVHEHRRSLVSQTRRNTRSQNNVSENIVIPSHQPQLPMFRIHERKAKQYSDTVN